MILVLFLIILQQILFYMKTSLDILTDFDSFSEETTALSAFHFFEKTHFSHFAVTKNNILIGMLPKKEILLLKGEQTKIGDLIYLLQEFKIKETVCFLDLLTAFSTNNTNILPVVNNEKYIGYTTLQEVMHQSDDFHFLESNAFTLVVEKTMQDCSFSEVSQIVEGSSGEILGLLLRSLTKGQAIIEVKIRAVNSNEIMQTFRRYDYHIISQHQEDYYIENLEENSEYLEKYLSI